MSVNELFESPIGTTRLRRWPKHKRDALQAWDGADRLLLEAWAAGSAQSVWVLNDLCGALALPLLAKGVQVTSVGDSWVAQETIRRNALDNHLDSGSLDYLWEPPSRGDSPPLQALARVPKSLTLFESQLASLAQSLPAGTQVSVAAMDKHVPDRLVEILERWLGEVQRPHGRFKAHLYQTVVKAPCKLPRRRWPTEIHVPALGVTLLNEAGVFSQERLDPGAALMLQHLPAVHTERIADLGCGNGVLGIALAMQSPEAEVWLCDESAAAVRSARSNADTAGVRQRTHIHHGNGLDGLTQQFDVVMLNPPFHRGHAVDTLVAEMLFDHALRHLYSGGRLRVIGNRHLPYAAVLRRRFAKVRQVASDPKFVIWEAIRP